MPRRYRRIRRLRGGFLLNGKPNVSLSRRMPTATDYMDSLAKKGAYAVGSLVGKRYPRASAWAYKATGMTPGDMLFSFYNKFKSNTGFVVPGLGVLKRPSTSSSYSKITNKGTGLTTTKYSCGIPTSIPKSLDKNAYKQQYVVSSAGENFPVDNISASSATTRGVGQYLHLDDTDLTTFANLLPANTDAKSDLATMYMASAKSIVTITSASNMNMSLRIYECVSKKDTNIATYRTPEDAWKNGIDQMVGTSDSNSYKNIGVYPSMSPFFRDYWHVDSYYDIELAAGSSHVHKSNYNINSYVPFSWFRNHGGSAVTSGLTRAYLFVLSTTPVHDSTSEAAIALGRGKVDINILTTYEFYGIPFTDEGLSYDLGSDVVTTAEIVTDSDFIETTVVN